MGMLLIGRQVLQILRHNRMTLRQSLRRPSWLYPFKGMIFFAGHPFLYPLLRSRLLPCFLLSLFVFGALFFWTYLPQALLLLPFHGGAAFFNATILVLGEGATVTALLFEAFLVDQTLAAVFDSVLIAKGLEGLVGHGREVYASSSSTPSQSKPKSPTPAPTTSTTSKPQHSESSSPINGQAPEELNPTQRLGPPAFTPVYSPFSFKQIAEFILLLPLNLVPYVGVPAFLFLTGARAGPLHHHRYFKLRGLRRRERRSEINARRMPYTWFGTAALVLQLIPGLSMLFLMTTAAGSALWVSDLEAAKDARHQRGQERSPDREADLREEVYGPLEDDPLLERGDAV